MDYATTLGYGGRGTHRCRALVKASRPGGVHTTYTDQYDAMRRRTAEQAHAGGGSGPNLEAKLWSYDANGRQTAEQRATGFQSSSPYYATGWQTWLTSYTPTGKPASTTDPLNETSYTHYDALDRVFQVIDPTGLVEETDYDAAGEVLAQKRGVGTPLAQTYAAYGWTGDGNKASITDANGNLVRLSYDGFNRVSAITFADGTSEGSQYDLNGDLTIWTNRGGFGIVRCYDVLGRKLSERGITGATNAGLCPTGGTANLSSRSWDISDRSFGYDLAGRLASATNTLGAGPWGQDWYYDAAGRLSSFDSNLGAFGYSYDAASNPTAIAYGDGFAAAYAYDALHRMTGSYYQLPGSTSPGTAATIAYDPLSRRTGVTFGDGSTQAYAYDAADRVRTITHVFPGGASSNVTYTYGYDAAGRDVSRAIANAGYRAYPTVGTTAYGAANGLNQYPSVGGSGYAYWPEGPLSGDGVLQHLYDELGGQAYALGAGGAQDIQWSRDALGQAVFYGRVTGSGTQGAFMGLDGSRPEAVLARITATPSGASSPTVTGDRQYVLGPEPDERLAFADVDGSVWFPHTDRQGSVIALSRGGSAATHWRYGPYGETPDAVTLPASPSDPSSYPYRYTGQLYDSNFGLYDDKARTYSPALGRFLQPDPAGVDMGPNLYAYVGNDPLGAEDPGGMRGCVIRYGCGGGISTVEGVVGSDANVENALLANGQMTAGQGTSIASAPNASGSGVAASPLSQLLQRLVARALTTLTGVAEGAGEGLGAIGGATTAGVAVGAATLAYPTSTAPAEEDETSRYGYHYTTLANADAIRASGVIKANDRNRVYFSDRPFSANETNNALFAGSKPNNGEAVVAFRYPSSLPRNYDPSTGGPGGPGYYHSGSLRNGRGGVQFLYVGPNTYNQR